MIRSTEISFSDEAKKIFDTLFSRAKNSKFDKVLVNAINQKVGFIRANNHYGNPIAKRLIPKQYKIKYGVTNLFRVELPFYWRMLYTLDEPENKIEIIAFVIDIVDHKDYDRKFGYEKR